MDASRITMNWQAHASARTIQAGPVLACAWLRGRVFADRSDVTSASWMLNVNLR
jgi:hypothetical protein